MNMQVVLATLEPNNEEVREARQWFRKFMGKHTVNMSDKDVVQLYREVNAKEDA